MLRCHRGHTISHVLKHKTDHQARGVGFVRGGDSRFYFLDNTGYSNISHISNMLWEGQPIRPTCFHIEPLYTCSFYDRAIAEQGPLIGTFEGPAEGNFDEEYAVWYSCWGTGSVELGRMNDRHWPRPLDGKPCGALGVCPRLGGKVSVYYINSGSTNLPPVGSSPKYSSQESMGRVSAKSNQEPAGGVI